MIIRRPFSSSFAGKSFICQGKYCPHVVFHSGKSAKGTINKPINMREIFEQRMNQTSKRMQNEK